MKRVLVAALDWGLVMPPDVYLWSGYCVNAATVSLASSGEAGVASGRVSDLPYYELPAYKPYYDMDPG